MRSSLARLSKRQISSCLKTTLHVSRDFLRTNQHGSRHSFIPLVVSSERTISLSTDHPIGSSETLKQTKTKARELINEQIHPPGSFTPSHGIEAKHVLDFLKKVKATDAESMNLAVALIERLVAERVLSNDGVQSNWVCEPHYFTPLLNLWKEAAKQGERVMSPRDLLQKLQAMSRTLPEFRYNIVAVNLIMDVAIKQAHPKKAPFIAEEMLNFVRKEAAETRNMQLRPDAFIYNNVMQAWAVSGLPQAPDKMDAFLQTMRQEEIAPDEVTYNILLRYWATKGAVEKVESILDTMESEGIQQNRTSLAPAIYCYTKVGNTNKAEELLQQMIEARPRDKREDGMVAESTQNILLAYRRIVDDSNHSFEQKEKTVESAEALFRNMRKRAQFTDEDHSE